MHSAKTKKSCRPFVVVAVALAIFEVASLAHATDELTESPVRVSQYDPNRSLPDLDERDAGPTVQEIQAYLHRKHEDSTQNSFLDLSGDPVRIRDFDPISASGKIVIKVHKSESRSRPEYLEVFRQRSGDPSDLEAIPLFDQGQSNRALVSTAGTFSGKVYTTPSGNFALDSMEEMHYSSIYDNAPMPWSIFFNGGIAIHGATPSEYAHLGRKASHGCVRVHPTHAKLLFNLIRKDGRSNVVVQVLDQ